ncbi:MAG: hypothetical protein LBU14_00610 [Candidatus Peribacteria bacterium]|nr:hypothetical protein [Candidatus Peribacteria bacterium]
MSFGDTSIFIVSPLLYQTFNLSFVPHSQSSTSEFTIFISVPDKSSAFITVK